MRLISNVSSYFMLWSSTLLSFSPVHGLLDALYCSSLFPKSRSSSLRHWPLDFCSFRLVEGDGDHHFFKPCQFRRLGWLFGLPAMPCYIRCVSRFNRREFFLRVHSTIGAFLHIEHVQRSAYDSPLSGRLLAPCLFLIMLL